LSGPARVALVGTDNAMYYDASSSDYISTPSFAIPDTGILTIEVWMKSQVGAQIQTIVGEGTVTVTLGWLWIFRITNSNTLRYRYANGTTNPSLDFVDFFQYLDNQYNQIVFVCDYTNKTLKAYRNGVQFGLTKNLEGTPLFPARNSVKYIGAFDATRYNLTDGSLDEVRIYNRGLGADEISAQYTNTKSRYGQ
jgi:hypothetical protein